MSDQASDARGERQVVVFDLAGETYGIDIGSVREIIRVPEITRVPGADRSVQGVVTLRGQVIPVIDMCRRLGLEATPPTKETRVVVVEHGDEDIGLIVDAVTEVLRVPEEAIAPATAAGDAAGGQVQGVAGLDGRLIILLDVAAAIARDPAPASAT